MGLLLGLGSASVTSLRAWAAEAMHCSSQPLASDYWSGGCLGLAPASDARLERAGLAVCCEAWFNTYLRHHVRSSNLEGSPADTELTSQELGVCSWDLEFCAVNLGRVILA